MGHKKDKNKHEQDRDRHEEAERVFHVFLYRIKKKDKRSRAVTLSRICIRPELDDLMGSSNYINKYIYIVR